MAAKRLTKPELFAALAKATNIPKKKVAQLFDALTEVMKKQLGSRGPGEFVFPRLLKVRVFKRPATNAREVINPRTGEKMTILAKPPSKKVRATALKGLKQLVE